MNLGKDEYKTVPIPEEWRPYGFWPAIVKKAREVSLKGEALVLDVPISRVRSAQRNLKKNSHTSTPADCLHTRYRGGSLYVWFTFHQEDEQD